ncbi:DMT family transporter [Vallitalea sp.]|jgi:drug/metabolite transporter (DMT)-like permease|uniref:DMT family transporter n=1 Tax=Vallitalea sp. TaxID=1882829 RepID=UPI0025D1BC05|nr:DMT family transporter [Vallitalea sp.]MCT4686112.1 DMT family transporter [Vallitalea sp.]
MDNKPKAVLFMLISAVAFALMQTMVKLAGNIPTFEKVLFRNMVSLFVALSVIYRTKTSMFGKKENRKYLLGRSLLGLGGVVFYFYAINNLIMADAAMLNKLSPFFVTIFACIFLKEKLNKIQIPSLIIVFIGAMLIIKPEFSFDVLPAGAGLLSAICAGAAYTIVRSLKNKENPSTIVFYFSFVSVIVMIPLTIMNFQMPLGIQWVYLIGTGIFAAMGQYGLTFAYKYAPASEISIYNYTTIIFAALMGFLVWGELPDWLSLLGSILIIVTAVVAFIYQNKRIDE